MVPKTTNKVNKSLARPPLHPGHANKSKFNNLYIQTQVISAFDPKNTTNLQVHNNLLNTNGLFIPTNTPSPIPFNSQPNSATPKEPHSDHSEQESNNEDLSPTYPVQKELLGNFSQKNNLQSSPPSGNSQTSTKYSPGSLGVLPTTPHSQRIKAIPKSYERIHERENEIIDTSPEDEFLLKCSKNVTPQGPLESVFTKDGEKTTICEADPKSETHVNLKRIYLHYRWKKFKTILNFHKGKIILSTLLLVVLALFTANIPLGFLPFLSAKFSLYFVICGSIAWLVTFASFIFYIKYQTKIYSWIGKFL